MSGLRVRSCQCPDCLTSAETPTKEQHRLMIRFFQGLGEKQRRLFAAMEARKIGHGGLRRLALITGLHVQTIRRGLRELDNPAPERVPPRVRRVGGGRPHVEKKRATLRQPCTTCSARKQRATP
jgi:hypothetical protein